MRPSSCCARTRGGRRSCSSGTGSTRSSLSYHEHNEAERTAQVLPRLLAGERVALTSDAGLPGVSDPGARLIAAALESGVQVTVLPGPSAVETALVASGLVGERYQFVGYLPRSEKARSALWDELVRWPFPVVAFESPRRLPASLESLAAASPERPVAVCRELSKRFEEVVRGTAAELAERFPEPPRGEITLVIGAYEAERGADDDAPSRGCRARRGRSGAQAGGRGRRTAHRPVPERALPPVAVARFDNSRPALYSGRMVFRTGNSIAAGSARAPRPGAGRVGVGVARRRTGAEAVRRWGSVRRRPAPRHRHRRSVRVERALRGERDRVVRRTIAAPGPLPHRTHRGRLLGHARPSRIDRGDDGHAGRRERRRRDDRADRRRRRRRAVRVSRHPAHGRPERVPRPAHASSTARAAGTTSGLAAAGARAGAAARSASRAGEPAAGCSQAREQRVCETPQEPPRAAADIRAAWIRAERAVAPATRSRGRRASECSADRAAPGSLRLERAARPGAGSSARARSRSAVRAGTRCAGARHDGSSSGSREASRAGAWIEARGADRDGARRPRPACRRPRQRQAGASGPAASGQASTPP